MYLIHIYKKNKRKTLLGKVIYKPSNGKPFESNVYDKYILKCFVVDKNYFRR